MGSGGKTALWAFAGAIGGVLIAGYINHSINEDTLRVKYVEISAGVLASEPTGMPENRLLRKWAVKNINEYAEIKLDKEVQRDLVEKTPLPVSLSGGHFPNGHFPEGHFLKGHFPEVTLPNAPDSKVQ